MINHKKILAVIPARGGSKRIPHKNIRLLGGKPLISYSIKATRQSKLVDLTIVSTDDQNISMIAKKNGAEVPFIRPSKLATSKSKTIDVLIHAVNFIERHNKKIFDIIALIQPTSPFILPEDIDRAIENLEKTNANCCISLCEISERPEWMYRVNNNKVFPFGTRIHNINKRSQDLKKIFRINGAAYIIRREILLNKKMIIDENNLTAIIMPRERSIDIDELIDLQLAEIILKNNFIDQ
ncbi:MAG: acylneuraminate cytidylyltransferase family protein [Patescibacteria group bacterium]|nr:acylneuraminate cytidylyltransferase family protein [Patescibacteria group bacterium]MDD5715136.1 acylneuraminate cytidylyltransferase family protein [Patescibacteria group bacterium]